MFIQLRYAAGLFLLFFVTTIWAEIAVPPLSQRVTDLTATLSAEQNAALENKLAAFETKKGSQIAVLILPTTQPEAIEAFSIRVADSWKIGRKGIDDGVILIVAKEDRKLRIEVGRGLEGAIPDAIAKRVIAEIITPKFKANDFAGGIDAGVSQLIKLVEGETLPVPTADDSKSNTSDWIWNIANFLLGIGFFGFMFLDAFFVERFGNFKGTVCTGICVSIVATIINFLFTFDIIVSLIVGLGAFFVGIVASCLFKGASSGSSNSSDSSWSSGGSSSWGGSGGGFSGGGASGSW